VSTFGSPLREFSTDTSRSQSFILVFDVADLFNATGRFLTISYPRNTSDVPPDPSFSDVTRKLFRTNDGADDEAAVFINMV